MSTWYGVTDRLCASPMMRGSATGSLEGSIFWYTAVIMPITSVLGKVCVISCKKYKGPLPQEWWYIEALVRSGVFYNSIGQSSFHEKGTTM
ncbi:hypothetical protein CesoFtcFv8_005296 [Champsocephalus esox]|uniref:Uncharacterized protein n=1 Tax=Champsocephalus esox TaxID=159716 RepID=A0AAN8CPR4_9TELE|nr:hypothetical protein CesoFtcFv8_005296 [Champsocephalus esox]